MSYLLYCIFHHPLQPGIEMTAGVGGQPVFAVRHERLCAGLSELGKPNSSPDLTTILAFERIVESIHRCQTVIPIRYGCEVEDPADAVRLLGAHYHEYGALLHDLDGLAEMSIQILSYDPASGDETYSTTLAPKPFLSAESGSDYLAALRRHYAQTDGTTLCQDELVKTLCDSLSGLFVRRKVEGRSVMGCRLQSIHFLVSHTSVELFRQAAQQLFKEQTAKLLLSGPWPPYNFVEISQKDLRMC